MTNTSIEPAALSRREYEFLSRITQTCMWLARLDEDESLERCAVEFGLSEAQALTWIKKAQEYMALGAVETTEQSKRLYQARLEEIYALCMSRSCIDEVEVTTKPMSLKVDGKDEYKQVTGQITKVKPNSFNANAVQIALKAAREIAHIQGARPGGKGGTSIGNLNVLSVGADGQAKELPGAHVVDQLANADLAALAGVEIVDEQDLPKRTRQNGEGHAGD